MCREPLHQLGKVVAGEVPLEGLGDLVPVVLELVEGAREHGEVLEGVGLEQLALEDREEDLHLVEPARVHGQVDEADFGQRPSRRSTDLRPRWEEPLSTIQKTRRAET